MSSSLKEDLASLKIDRSRGKVAGLQPASQAQKELQPQGYVSYKPSEGRTVRRGFGWLLLSLSLWLIPLSILGSAGYVVRDQVVQMRPAAEVKFATVQLLSEAELDKVLSAKGYLRSRNQAEVGAKAPGRVEEMLVEEGDRVQTGQILAVLEHNDLKATLLTKKASVARTKA